MKLTHFFQVHPQNDKYQGSRSRGLHVLHVLELASSVREPPATLVQTAGTDRVQAATHTHTPRFQHGHLRARARRLRTDAGFYPGGPEPKAGRRKLPRLLVFSRHLESRRVLRAFVQSLGTDTCSEQLRCVVSGAVHGTGQERCGPQGTGKCTDVRITITPPHDRWQGVFEGASLSASRSSRPGKKWPELSYLCSFRNLGNIDAASVCLHL